MSRLIDVDKLIEDIKINDIGDRIGDSQIDIIKAINRQPIAYVLDEVVEQLERLRDKANLNVLKNMNEPIPYSSASNRVYAYDKAIEIVKAGGLDE